LRLLVDSHADVPRGRGVAGHLQREYSVRARDAFGGDRTGTAGAQASRLAGVWVVWRCALSLESHDGQRPIHHIYRFLSAIPGMGIGRGLSTFANVERQ